MKQIYLVSARLKAFARVLLPLILLYAGHANATDYFVTNGNNAGAGSLRQAILDANANAAGAPHTITFTYSGVVTVSTSLPAITRRVTIDGVDRATRILNAPGGNNTVALMVLGAGSGGSTIRNLTLRNTGANAVQLAVALTGVTLENLNITQTGVHYLNRGVVANAAQTNLTIRNVKVTGLEDKQIAIHFADKATNLLMEGVEVSGGGGVSGRAMHFQGVVTGAIIRNSLFNMDDPAVADDGDYGIFFAAGHSGVEIDNTTFNNCEVHAIYAASTSSNFTVKNSTFNNLVGSGTAIHVKFVGNTNIVTFDNNTFNADQQNVTDDADYAIQAPAASNQRLTLTNNKFFDYDVLAVRIGWSDHVNNHDNVLIQGNEFARNGSLGGDQGALMVQLRNTSSDGGPILITENIFRNNTGSAIGLYPGNGATYVIPNFTISKNTIYGNTSTQGAIDIRWVDKIVITQNSIYNNRGLGIDLANEANCGYELANRPQLISSTETAAGVYNVVVKMPAFCGTNACSLELFANNAGVTGASAQHYINTYTGLGSGNRTLTGVTAPTIAALNQAPFGFWAATLKLTNNCGTSEISNRIGIKPTGPAGVSAGVQLWLKSDDFNAGNLVANTGWEDASGNNRNFSTLVSDPAAVKSGLNFNNYVNFDGNDYLYSPTYGYAAAFTAGEAITVLRSGSNNAQRGYPYDFGGTPRGIHYTWTDGAVYTSFGTNDRLGHNPTTKVVTDAKAATTVTGAAINVLNWNIMGNYAAAGSWGLDFNGGQQTAVSTANTVNFTLPGGREFIAYDGSSKLAFLGDISETVLYSRKLSETERKQINTYLSIRSGLTIFHDYIAANGITTLWSLTGNTGYNNGIAGLYRDDLGIIHQRQSKTISMNDSLTVAMGNKIFTGNDDNETDIANDRAALIWGNNKLATTYSVAVTGTNVTARLARVWKVQKTNWSDAQEITLKFVGATDKNYLIISTTAGFTTLTHEVKLNKDGSVTIPSSYLTNGGFFTLGRQQFYPGGVATGLATWMKAGEDYTLSGTTVTQVIDQAPAQRNWTRMYNRTLNWFNTGYNYNAYIQFPNNEHLNTPQFTTTFTNGEVFSVQASPLERNSSVTTYSFPWQLGGIANGSTPPSYRNTGNVMWPTFGSTTRLSFSYAPKDLSLPTLLNLASGGNTWSANIDGRAMVTNAANTTNFTVNNYIGAGAGAFFTGTLPEVIMYNRKLNATEKLKVASYMAIKYGITLEQPVSALDYLASDGTTIWTSSANPAYKANITAIGRDDLSALHQKQSRSANATTASYFTIATGEEVMPSNEENTDAIINDKSFFFWSDNNFAVTYSTAVTGEKATMRMPRIWKARKSNWADMPVTLKMHYPASNVYLLISTDPTFAAINEEIPVNADGTVSFESNTIPDGAYFTFAKEIKGPGLVNTGVQFWLRADDGVSSGAAWNDFSGNDNNAVQPTVASQPVFSSSNTNFNPAFVLDGANDFMNFSTNAGISGTNQFTVVSVSKRSPANTSDIILGAPTDAANGFGYGYNVNKFFVTATNTGTLSSTANYTAINIPMLHAATRAAGNVFSIYANGAADGGGTAAWNLLSNNLRLGWRGGTTTDQYSGAINEVVVYNRVLSAAELQQVNSYLALKHGLTLANGTQDYIATDGTTRMWTVSKNTGYVQAIAGLGKDEATSLNQKQSVSAVDNTITIALGGSIFPSNAENPNEMDDRSFFTWSSNGAPVLFMIPVTSTPNATARFARVWKVDRTNWTDQDITMKFVQNGDRYLLVNTSNDPMFGATGTTEYPINTATGTITINTADLPDGAYFTLASKLTGPACVNGNISAWLRADYGSSTPGSWIDFSGLQRHGMQSTPAAIPTVVETGMNFNPAFRFNGTSQFMNIAPNVINPGNTNYSIIAVTKPNNLNEKQVVFLGATATNQGILLQYNNNNPGGGANTIEASWGGNPFFGGATVLNKTDLLSSTYSTTVGRVLRQDGTQVGTNATITGFNYTQTIGNIGSMNGSLFYSGDLSELVVYNTKALTGAELQRVESYLSLKYGITMAAGSVDYLGSDGTTIMWNAADNAGFNFRITGIGRDDCTELYQKQSINSNGGILALGVGEISTTNILNTNTIDNNNSYLFIADNNLAVDYTMDISGLNNLTARMARIWKVDKTNFADRDVIFKLNGGNEKIYLVVSPDNTFDGTDAAYQLDADGNVSVLTADLPDGAYFTFAKELRGPGYVNVGINQWLRADDGVSAIDNWIDYSGNESNAVQPTAANQPVFNNVTTNYNPGFVFNGTSTHMAMTMAKFPIGTSARTLLAVGTPTNVTGNRYMFGFGNGATNGYNSLMNVANQVVYSGYGNDLSGVAGSAAISVPQELMGTYAGGTNAVANLYSKSRLLASQAKGWNTVAGGAYIGMLSNSTQYWQGPLNEIATYNRALDAFERQRISSYLAMKYGYTMDQTTATSYVATDFDGTSGTTYWDATANATYKNNIAGIGRDDKTGLNQKQSRSVNTAANGNMIAIGLNNIEATNLDNTSTFADDLSFLVWGDDGLTGTKNTEYPNALDPGTCSKITRLQREWKVQKTGSIDVVQLKMFLTGLVPTSTSLSDLKLLVNNSSDFTAASTTVIVPSSYDAATLTATFNNLSLADGQYFTLVTDLTNEAPGGVKDPLYTWYRADKGVTTATGISNWADQSINAKDVTQATAAAQPAYNTTNKLFNFNPSITFNGTSNVLTNTTINHSAAAGGEEVFTVLIPRDGDFLGFGRTTTGTEQFSRFYTNTTGQLGWVSRVGTNAGSLLTTANNLGKIQLANMHRSASPAGAGVIEYNGASTITGAQNFFPIQNQLNIGSRRYNASGSVSNDLFFNGEMAEVAVFSRELMVAERQRVASYFGLKYGLTLSHDYLDPDGTVLWNTTANAAYNYNITGIGRDDCNGLHQKQSRSVNTAEALITLGNGMGITTTNTDNSNDLGNKTALVLGDDNGNRTTWTVTNAPADRKRIARTWKVQETNTVSSVTIQAPGNASASAVKLPLEKAGKMYLLVSNSTDFTGTLVEMPMTLNGDMWETSYDFTDGQYFTFATGGECVDNTAVLTAYNAETAAATDKCYTNGWILFKDPVDAGKYIAAIYDPAQLIDRTKITAKVNVNAAFNDLGKGSAQKASRLMRRLLEINCASCYDAVANPQPAFVVRMFYSSTEKTGAENGETNNIEAIKTANGLTDAHAFTWFKAAGMTAAQVVSRLTADGGIGGGGQEWGDGALVTGTMDGTEYVDFDGVNGFSTFGGIWTVNLEQVLPVSWGEVKAAPVNNQYINVSWTTHSELNNHHFVVERSEAGGTFTLLTTIGGRGTTNATNNYSFDDRNVKSGILYQYRIRQVDIDGRSSFSKIVVAKLAGNGDKGLVIRPNPVVTNTLRYEITVQRGQYVQANVLDAAGRVLARSAFRANSGWNQFTTGVGTLSKGTYMLQLILEDGSIISERFIKK